MNKIYERREKFQISSTNLNLLKAFEWEIKFNFRWHFLSSLSFLISHNYFLTSFYHKKFICHLILVWFFGVTLDLCKHFVWILPFNVNLTINGLGKDILFIMISIIFFYSFKFLPHSPTSIFFLALYKQIILMRQL